MAQIWKTEVLGELPHIPESKSTGIRTDVVFTVLFLFIYVAKWCEPQSLVYKFLRVERALIWAKDTTHRKPEIHCCQNCSFTKGLTLKRLSVKLKCISSFSSFKILVFFDKCKINQNDRKCKPSRLDWIPQPGAWEKALCIVSMSDESPSQQQDIVRLDLL